MAVWCSGNALVLINAVALQSSPVSTGMDHCLQVVKLSHYITSHPGQLSLSIPPWVGAMILAMVMATVREETASSA